MTMIIYILKPDEQENIKIILNTLCFINNIYYVIYNHFLLIEF